MRRPTAPRLTGIGLLALLAVPALMRPLLAQSPAPSGISPRSPGQPPAAAPEQLPDHPVAPVVAWAQRAADTLERTGDYSCTFVKRERIDGQLGEHQYLFLKIRHKPFSVYIYFLGPEDVKGREALYVEGRNDGNLMAHSTGLTGTLIGTVSLKPDSAMAMQGNRHPITRAGMLNLTRRITELGQQAMRYAESDVKYFPGAKVNGRVCTCIQLVHQVERPEFAHHMRRIFVDDELGIPIRYEAYDWPKEPGAAPELSEEYTYLDLKFNQNFTDADFDPGNPNYRFR